MTHTILESASNYSLKYVTSPVEQSVIIKLKSGHFTLGDKFYFLFYSFFSVRSSSFGVCLNNFMCHKQCYVVLFSNSGGYSKGFGN